MSPAIKVCRIVELREGLGCGKIGAERCRGITRIIGHRSNRLQLLLRETHLSRRNSATCHVCAQGHLPQTKAFSAAVSLWQVDPESPGTPATASHHKQSASVRRAPPQRACTRSEQGNWKPWPWSLWPQGG